MTTYSIFKCLRNDKPMKRNGKYPIYLLIRVGNRITKIPTGLDIKKEEWDTKKYLTFHAARRSTTTHFIINGMEWIYIH